MQTINRLITQHKHDPNYKVGKSKLGLKGKTIPELIKRREEIYERRRGTQPLSKQLEEGKRSLKPTPPHKSKEYPPTPFEKAVTSRRHAFELSDNEGDFPEQDWEAEGSGITDEAEKLINRLYLS